MRYQPSQSLLYVAGLAAALSGCGKEAQQTNVSANNSGLERTVLAEQVNGAGSKGSGSQKEELDLSTPEKALDKLRYAFESRNEGLAYQLFNFDRMKQEKGSECGFLSDFKQIFEVGRYKITKREQNKVIAEMSIGARAGGLETEPLEVSNATIEMDSADGKWKIYNVLHD